MDNIQIEIAEPDTMDVQIKQYVEANKPHICILTATPSEQCCVQYTVSLANTIILFSALKIEIKIEFVNDTLAARAKNTLISKAMADPKITHLIFIDNMMGWNPYDVIKLMLSQKAIIGGVYPINTDYSKLLKNGTYDASVITSWMNSKSKTHLTDDQTINFNLLKYSIDFKELAIANNIAKVQHVAPGFMLIQRQVIEKMMTSFASTKCGDVYALFDYSVENEIYLTETELFCKRWANIGGEIFMDVTLILQRVANTVHSGFFLSTII